MTILDEVFTPDIIIHQHPYPDYHLEALKRHIADNNRAFHGLHNTLEAVVSKGDLVIVRAVEEGTHSGEFEGIKPTGKKIRTTWIAIFRIAHSKIVEGWLEANDRSLYDQLGVPTPSLAATP